MESLEEFDIAKELNFKSSQRFLQLAEEELAALVLRGRFEGGDPGTASKRFALTFPPLQPRYAQLLHALLVRFDLKFTVHGWGEERRITAETSNSQGCIPVVRCSDFLGQAGLDNSSMRLLARLQDSVLPSEVETADRAPSDSPAGFQPEHDDRAEMQARETPSAAPVKRKRAEKPPGGRMRGWSSEEEDSEGSSPGKAGPELETTNSYSKVGSGPARVMRGRGFLSPTEDSSVTATGEKETDDVPAKCRLRGDYERYVIDPEDTWRPHRKPYVELSAGWEFSHAWSFEPELNPNKPKPDHMEVSGVATWRVEHERDQEFAVCFGKQSQEMRRWLAQRAGSRGSEEDEPYVLEFRLLDTEKRWDFRFGRAQKTSDAKWKRLPWTNPRHTVFWVASFVGEVDDKRYLQAGLDSFPGRRFFSARLAARPKVVGFGLPKQVGRTFFVRDIVFFGRGSLQSAPFAGRDHFVEVLLSVGETEALLRKAGLQEGILGVLSLRGGLDSTNASARQQKVKTPWRSAFSPGCFGDTTAGAKEELQNVPSADCKGDCIGPCTLVVCTSPEQAQDIAASLQKQSSVECKTIKGIQRTWPPAAALETGYRDPGGWSGPEAAKHSEDQEAEELRSLTAETVRELGFFKEHLERKTRHLEGTRIARSAAMRMILSGLSGPAPAPPAPIAGV
eukprot:TRINITY_DN34776_c0_g1_i1.p1 TRINITY_DN34776_c0_g1~~TRINITY_DN34776_c0_g1_i1.p1  ORF type:complete len:677 (-),score=126.07 TRINITY_DN34776_c0_g1_i1:208-2238(-)